MRKIVARVVSVHSGSAEDSGNQELPGIAVDLRGYERESRVAVRDTIRRCANIHGLLQSSQTHARHRRCSRRSWVHQRRGRGHY